MYPYDRLTGPGGLLPTAADLAAGFLQGLAERRVASSARFADLVSALGGSLPEEGEDPIEVIEALARSAEPGLVATAGPRYFGFVIGGSLPAALAADWLTSAWDQNAGLCALSPAAAAVEEVTAGWVKSLLGLPEGASVGFVTGCQMASFVGLAAGRHEVLRRAGWDVERDGLQGAPAVNVVIGEEAHATILSALKMLGLGAGRAIRVAADGQGRMRPDALRAALEGCAGPTLVCAQAGNVNTGAFDPFEEIVPLVRERGAWLHVDGAFGLWAAAASSGEPTPRSPGGAGGGAPPPNAAAASSGEPTPRSPGGAGGGAPPPNAAAASSGEPAPERRALARGVDGADSWATDAHKWLNVPYDSGLAIVRDRNAHVAPLSKRGAYLVRAEGERDGDDFTPDSSQRARVFALYAALRSLGRRGVGELVERGCLLARRMAERLSVDPRVRILNDVVLNQVLVRFEPSGVDADAAAGDAFTRAVIARVQAEGTCWLGGTRWRGSDAMRVSVSSWWTTPEDIDRSAEAILAASRAEAR